MLLKCKWHRLHCRKLIEEAGAISDFGAAIFLDDCASRTANRGPVPLHQTTLDSG